jgi:hypothetical protein
MLLKELYELTHARSAVSEKRDLIQWNKFWAGRVPKGAEGTADEIERSR